jgi:hypothetical protein
MRVFSAIVQRSLRDLLQLQQELRHQQAVVVRQVLGTVNIGLLEYQYRNIIHRRLIGD